MAGRFANRLRALNLAGLAAKIKCDLGTIADSSRRGVASMLRKRWIWRVCFQLCAGIMGGKALGLVVEGVLSLNGTAYSNLYF